MFNGITVPGALISIVAGFLIWSTSLPSLAGQSNRPQIGFACRKDPGGRESNPPGKLFHLKLVSSAEEAERLQVEIGYAFEGYPCELVVEALRAGFAAEQIAEFISALPIVYVDRPCQSAGRLQRRLRKLNAVAGAERVELEKIVAESWRRDLRECESSKDAGE